MPEIAMIPLEALRESKTNPRRRFPQAAMEQLAASIREHGVLNPLLVRPTGAIGNFEIVCGARRLRAAKVAGVEEVPAQIRELEDDQVLEIQVIENLQREDVHPLDEAQGYAALLERGLHDVAALAARVGRSESYVYQRLKLGDLTEPAREAFWAEKIGLGHALLLARLQPADQQQALEHTLPRGQYDPEPMSAGRLRAWIEQNLILALKSAPFSKADADLVEGAPPCKECPKRTGYTPALFPDIEGADKCTDPDCFHAKLAAATAQKIAAAEEKGEPLLQVSTHRYYPDSEKPLPEGVLEPGKWVRVGRGQYDKRCEHLQKAIVVAGSDDRGKVIEVCAEPKCEMHHYQRGGGMSQRAERAKAREDKLLDDRQAQAVLAGLLDLMGGGDVPPEQQDRAAYPTPVLLPVEHLRAIGRQLIHALPWSQVEPVAAACGVEPRETKKFGGQEYDEALIEHMNGEEPDRLPRLVLEIALRSSAESLPDIAEVAQQCGLDPEPIKARVAAERRAELKAAAAKRKRKSKPTKRTKSKRSNSKSKQ